MVRRVLVTLMGLAPVGVLVGCGTQVGQEDKRVSNVANRAVDVAEHIGGDEGFGGTMMDGYLGHAPMNMGFADRSDLGSVSDGLSIRFSNQTDQPGTFNLHYVFSEDGLDDQTMDVEVAAGDSTLVEMPCAEIVGVGPLDQPGALGCTLGDGTIVDNTMAVPGFLGLDYACGGVYECVVTRDVDDLDGDGDTTEWIILSDAMTLHMQNGGPDDHMHGTGPGMMGGHMSLP